MANATLPTDWLIEACGGKKKQEMPHAGSEEKPRYGMDASGDGMMDKAELDAYYEVKKQAELDLQKEHAVAAAA